MSKYVLVTGACVNTGVDIVEKYASENVNVVFTGRNLEKVENAKKEYEKKYPKVKFIGFELNSLIDERTVDEEAVKRTFDSLDRRGIIVKDVILNAADQGLGQAIWENPLTDFMKVINTNVTWNYCICEQASKRMKNIGGGSITFINSNTAYRAIPNRIAYETSKGAQLGMMRGLAFDLGKYNIRVNAILPGMIKTDRWINDPDFYKSIPSRYTPLGDVALGRDIADACWYFTELARNTTGAELTVDGGNTVQLYPIIPKE